MRRIMSYVKSFVTGFVWGFRRSYNVSKYVASHGGSFADAVGAGQQASRIDDIK